MWWCTTSFCSITSVDNKHFMIICIVKNQQKKQLLTLQPNIFWEVMPFSIMQPPSDFMLCMVQVVFHTTGGHSTWIWFSWCVDRYWACCIYLTFRCNVKIKYVLSCDCSQQKLLHISRAKYFYCQLAFSELAVTLYISYSITTIYIPMSN